MTDVNFKKKKVKCLGQGDSYTRKILSQGISKLTVAIRIRVFKQ